MEKVYQYKALLLYAIWGKVKPEDSKWTNTQWADMSSEIQKWHKESVSIQKHAC